MLSKIIEGKTSLNVPTSSLTETIPPKSPAFFNPQAKLNRDISMGVYRVFTKNRESPISMGDPFAGVGARGVRVAVEVPKVDQIFINDGNRYALNLAKKSAILNQVADKCKFSNREVCNFLSIHSAPKKRFSIIDIDPFGSPASFFDCGIRATMHGGILSTAATDLQVLNGLFQGACKRNMAEFQSKQSMGMKLQLD